MTVSIYAVWFLWGALAYELAGWIARALWTRRAPIPQFRCEFAEEHIWIGYLYHFGVIGGSLQFSETVCDHSLRFEKTDRDDTVSGIAIGMPASGWNGNDLAKLRAYCNEN